MLCPASNCAHALANARGLASHAACRMPHGQLPNRLSVVIGLIILTNIIISLQPLRAAFATMVRWLQSLGSTITSSAGRAVGVVLLCAQTNGLTPKIMRPGGLGPVGRLEHPGRRLGGGRHLRRVARRAAAGAQRQGTIGSRVRRFWATHAPGRGATLFRWGPPLRPALAEGTCLG